MTPVYTVKEMLLAAIVGMAFTFPCFLLLFMHVSPETPTPPKMKTSYRIVVLNHSSGQTLFHNEEAYDSQKEAEAVVKEHLESLVLAPAPVASRQKLEFSVLPTYSLTDSDVSSFVKKHEKETKAEAEKEMEEQKPSVRSPQ